MRKLWSLLLVLSVACLVAVGTASAADKKAEKPKVSPEERFNKLDTNKDGFIDEKEFLASMKDQEKAEKAWKALLKAKDKDGDGKISKEEYFAKPEKKGGKKKG
jgi:Ca2+-binding EF-hand superfamily protein